MTTIKWHKISTIPKTDGWKICVLDNDGDPFVRPLYYYCKTWFYSDDIDFVDNVSQWEATRWADMPKVKKL